MTSQPEGLLKKNATAGRFQEKCPVGLCRKFSSDSPNKALGSVRGCSAVLVMDDHMDASLALEEFGQ